MSSRSAVLLVCLSASLLFFAYFAYFSGYIEIGEGGYFAPIDDIMISQRYARNLSAGKGLVYNEGERIEGFSNPAMVLAVFLPVELLDIDERYRGLAIWCVNAMVHSAVALVLVLGGLYRKHAIRLTAILVFAAYISDPMHGIASATGFSVYWQMLFILLLMDRLHGESRIFYLYLSILPLLHSILYPIWLGFIVARFYYRRDQLMREALPMLISILPMFFYLLFRIAYYGEIFPNTYYLKSGNVIQLEQGLRYLLSFAGEYWILGLCFILSAIFIGRKALAEQVILWLVLFGVYLALIVKIGGDLFLSRVLMIFIPFMLFNIKRWENSWRSSRVFSVSINGFLALAIVSNLIRMVGLPQNEEISEYLEWQKQRIVLGMAIRENSEAEDRVALFGLGWTGYLSDRYVIDMLGKTDCHISHTAAKPWRRLGHQKDDPVYIMSLKPEYVECIYSKHQLADLEFLKKERLKKCGYWAELALDETFRRDYRRISSQFGPLPLCARKDIAIENWRIAEDVFGYLD